MDRFKRRIALSLVTVALSGAFAASPASAAESCHPMPDVVCNTQEWYEKCVVLWLHGYSDPDCRA